MDRGILQLVSRSLAERKRRRVPSSSSSPTRFFKRVIFFLPEQGWFILHCTQGVLPTERQSIPARLLKTSWDFQVCLCVRNITFGPIFSSKTTKYRRISSVPLLHIGVPPCHGDRGPPCFLLGFSLQWESQFEAGKNFLSGKFARCWKWFLYNILMLLGYYSHLLQKRWEFLYPRRHEKARRRRPPSTTAGRKIELGLTVRRAVFPQPLQRTDSVAFRN